MDRRLMLRTRTCLDIRANVHGMMYVRKSRPNVMNRATHSSMMTQMPLPSGAFSSSIDSSEDTGPNTLEIDIICHRISVVKMTGQMSSSTDEYRGPLTIMLSWDESMEWVYENEEW